MKYTLEGYQQAKLLEYDFTVITACVLRTLDNMQKYYEKRIIEDKEYFWLDQGHLVEQLPAVAKRTKILSELKGLEEKGFIEKQLKHEKNGIRGNWSYIRLTEKVAELDEYDISSVKNNSDLVRDTNKVMRDTNNPCSQDEFDLVRKTNNKELINNITKKNNKKNTPSGVTTQKTSFGEFKNVILTQEEYNKLISRYNEKDVLRNIEAMSCYIDSSGKNYKKYYSALLGFLARDNKAIELPKVEVKQVVTAKAEPQDDTFYWKGEPTKYTNEYIRNLCMQKWDEEKGKMVWWGQREDKLNEWEVLDIE